MGRRAPVYGQVIERRIVALADERRAHPALAVMRWNALSRSYGDFVSLHLADYRNGTAVGRGCRYLL